MGPSSNGTRAATTGAGSGTAAKSTTHTHIRAIIATECAALPAIDIVDAGCGNGDLIAYLATTFGSPESGVQARLFGFDVEDSGHVVTDFPASTIRRLAEAAPEVPWSDRITLCRVGDAWPYADGSMDVVCSNQVVEHVADLEFFFGEVARTLRPGGVSIHVFPLRRMIWEVHVSLPMVHWTRDDDMRASMIRWLDRLGLGRRQEYVRRGFDRDGYVEAASRLVQQVTFYRSWREVADVAKRAGLLATHRYTGPYYWQKARSVAGLPPVARYGRRHPLIETLEWAVLPSIASGTIVLRKPLSTALWQPHVESGAERETV